MLPFHSKFHSVYINSLFAVGVAVSFLSQNSILFILIVISGNFGKLAIKTQNSILFILIGLKATAIKVAKTTQNSILFILIGRKASVKEWLDNPQNSILFILIGQCGCCYQSWEKLKIPFCLY